MDGMSWGSKELSPLHQLPLERFSVSWLSLPTVSGMELGQHCLLEVYVWDSFINKGIMPQFKYEVFTPKAWVRKFWLLIQLYEQGVWGSDWIRWWIVFWWSPSMIALFGSGLGGQWDTSWMEISHPYPFFFSQLPSDEQSRLPHTPLTSGPQQWSTQTGFKSPRSELRGPSFFMLFLSVFIQSDETFDWHSWKMQTTKRPMCILETMCCHLAPPWLSALQGTVPNLCFLLPHWHTAHSWAQKVPFTGAWVDELTSAEYALNVP